MRRLIVALLVVICGQADRAALAEDVLGRHTPRGTVQGYLDAAREGQWTQAARFLNLASVPEADRKQQGPQLARELKIILDRTLWVDLTALHDTRGGNDKDNLPINRDFVGYIETKRGSFEISVERTRGENAVWLFSTPTVQGISPLYDEFGDGPIARWLPEAFVDWTVFEIRLWQWMGALVLLIAAYLLSWLSIGFILQILRPWVARSKTDFDDRLLAMVVAPLQLLLTIVLFASGATWFGFSVPAQQILSGAEITVAMFGVLWLLFRFIDLFKSVLDSRFRSKGQDVATHFLPLSARTLKISLSVVATLAALGSFGFDVTAIIAGLGVGGIAIALAAQKTLENIFGGVTVLLDQPVRPGDFCRYGDRIGTVEEIGIRSTRIRTLDRTLVTVPNGEFAILHLENFAKRDRILIRTTLGLRYETKPDQLRHVMIEIRKMLGLHPRIADAPRRIQLVAFGASSLDIELYCYVETQNWEDYLQVREDVFLRVIDIVDASGTGFAFPSQTTYIAKDDGLDSAKSEAALAQIAEWRAQGEI